MINPNDILIFILTCLIAVSGTYWIFFHLIPKQHEKNRIKQEAKERAEADRVLTEMPTWFTQNNFTEFEDTPIAEEVI